MSFKMVCLRGAATPNMRVTVWKWQLFWSEIQLNILLWDFIRVLFTYTVGKRARGILQHVTCQSFYFTWHIHSIWGFLTWPRATSTSVWFFQILWSFFPVCLVSHNFWKLKRPINLFSNCLWSCPYWLHLGQ